MIDSVLLRAQKRGRGRLLDQIVDPQRERVSLKYKNNNNFFSVTIHKLTLKDAGTYWCGVDTRGPDLYYTKVNLEVGMSYTHLIMFLLVPKSPLRAPQPLLAAFQWLPVLQLPHSHLRTQQGNQNRHLSPIMPHTFSLIPHQVHQVVLCTSVLVWLWWCLCWSSASSCSTNRRPEAGRHQPSLLDKNLTTAQEIPNSVHYAEVTISPGNHTSRHAPFSTDPSAIYSNVSSPPNQNPDSVDYSTVRFDRSEESLQYATVRFTDPPAGGDKQGSTSRDERDDAVIYSTINQDSQSAKSWINVFENWV
ncbi:CMRF35-like molecule 8 [Alosa sapidissima]|uniref:CMRF35-like molecule 8 n=1 Tax=Alosa sapidissima TaxID=34773 RepID=UPI001C089CB4|nr:CMRF35-like molecule 8 [Alosa sapidissima]